MADDMGLRQYITTLEERRAYHQAEADKVNVALELARETLGQHTKKAQLPPANDADTEGQPKPANGRYSAMGVEESALDHLERAGTAQKTAQVVNALLAGGIHTDAKNFNSTVFGSLRRLAAKGKAEKVGKGKWRAVVEQSVTPPWLTK